MLPGHNERSFHIFYQLLYGMDQGTLGTKHAVYSLGLLRHICTQRITSESHHLPALAEDDTVCVAVVHGADACKITRNPNDYAFLKISECSTVDGLDDKEGLQEVPCGRTQFGSEHLQNSCTFFCCVCHASVCVCVCVPH